jgi:hypothetical protein
MTDQPSLDALLDSWASAVRPDADELERMRRAIVEHPDPPSGLPNQWWRTLAFQVADIVVQAHRQPVLASHGWAS